MTLFDVRRAPAGSRANVDGAPPRKRSAALVTGAHSQHVLPADGADAGCATCEEHVHSGPADRHSQVQLLAGDVQWSATFTCEVWWSEAASQRFASTQLFPLVALRVRRPANDFCP